MSAVQQESPPHAQCSSKTPLPRHQPPQFDAASPANPDPAEHRPAHSTTAEHASVHLRSATGCAAAPRALHPALQDHSPQSAEHRLLPTGANIARCQPSRPDPEPQAPHAQTLCPPAATGDTASHAAPQDPATPNAGTPSPSPTPQCQAITTPPHPDPADPSPQFAQDSPPQAAAVPLSPLATHQASPPRRHAEPPLQNAALNSAQKMPQSIPAPGPPRPADAPHTHATYRHHPPRHDSPPTTQLLQVAIHDSLRTPPETAPQSRQPQASQAD